jgi:hypothetical protein
MPDLMKVHAGYALNVGVSEEELKKLVYLTTVPAGFGRAVQAAQTLGQLFTERREAEGGNKQARSPPTLADMKCCLSLLGRAIHPTAEKRSSRKPVFSAANRHAFGKGPRAIPRPNNQSSQNNM